MPNDLRQNLHPPTDLRTKLRCVAPLDPDGASKKTLSCKICNSNCILFDIVDFNKFCDPTDFYKFGTSGVSVDYWRCTACGFLFTPDLDGWSNADFAEFIYNSDYIQVDGEYAEARPSRMAEAFSGMFRGAETAKILDYGSGAGRFVQGMHDRGFRHIEGYDPFSSPQRPRGKFDIITSFEVIEHTIDPYSTFDDILSFLKPDGCIIVSQTLQPPDIMTIRGNWWYLAPRNGHVSTYTRQALEILAQKRTLSLYGSGNDFGFGGSRLSDPARIALQSIGASLPPGLAATAGAAAKLKWLTPRRVISRIVRTFL